MSFMLNINGGASIHKKIGHPLMQENLIMTVRPYRLRGRGRRDSVREGKGVRQMRLAFVLTKNSQLTTKAVLTDKFLAFHLRQKEGWKEE